MEIEVTMDSESDLLVIVHQEFGTSPDEAFQGDCMGSSVVERWTLIERSRVRVLAGSVGEVSSPR